MQKITTFYIIAFILLYIASVSSQISGYMGVLKDFVLLLSRLFTYGFVTALCSFIAFKIKDGLDKDDRILLKYAFVFLAAGTVFFIGEDVVQNSILKDTVLYQLLFTLGNIYFYGMHLSFIFRHMGKQREKIFNTIPYSKICNAGLLVCIGLTIIFTILYFMLTPMIFLKGIIGILFITSCVVYAGIIAIGMVYACRTLFTDDYPRANAILIAIGFLSFVFCEITIVYSIIFHEHLLLSKIITTIYYGPGFLLLALSGYRLGSNESK